MHSSTVSLPRRCIALALLISGSLISPAFLQAQSGKETEEFFAAVKAGDQKKVEFAVRQNSGLLQRADADGLTALHHAAAAGQAGFVRLFVERGAKLEAKTNNEEKLTGRRPYPNTKDYETVIGEKTPLQLTTDPQVAAYLLSKGARLPKREVTCAGDETWSLRRWKPAFASPELLAAALKAGADPNERCKANHGTCCAPTAYQFFDQPAFLRVLLDAGLNPDLPNLSATASRSASTSEPPTLLIGASRAGDVEGVKLLLQKKANANAKAPDGSTALAVARTPEIAALLRAAGAK